VRRVRLSVNSGLIALTSRVLVRESPDSGSVSLIRVARTRIRETGRLATTRSPSPSESTPWSAPPCPGDDEWTCIVRSATQRRSRPSSVRWSSRSETGRIARLCCQPRRKPGTIRLVRALIATVAAVLLLAAVAYAVDTSSQPVIAYTQYRTVAHVHLYVTGPGGTREVGHGQVPSVAPDGLMVSGSALGSSGPALTVYEMAGGRSHAFFSDRVIALPQAWSPDSRYLAVLLETTGRITSTGLAVIDTRTMTARTVATGVIEGASFAPSGPDRLVYGYEPPSRPSPANPGSSSSGSTARCNPGLTRPGSSTSSNSSTERLTRLDGHGHSWDLVSDELADFVAERGLRRRPPDGWRVANAGLGPQGSAPVAAVSDRDARGRNGSERQ
jgi:hypothetical protein